MTRHQRTRRLYLALGVALLLMVLVPTRPGAVIPAASCQQAAVQTAINTAVDGDVVVVPGGNCTWAGNVSVVNKAIRIQGAGVGLTVLTSTIADMGTSGMFYWTTKATGAHRITGFTFDSGTGGGNGQNALLWISGNSPQFVADHLKLIQRRHEGMRVTGNVRGVLSNINLEQRSFGAGFRVEHPAWGNVTSTCTFAPGGGCGDTSWVQPSTMGTADALYIEDSTIESFTGGFSFAADGWHGHRVVYRFNHFINTTVGNHGLESGGRVRGARHWEFYDNTTNFTTWAATSPMASRGGTGYVFDNVGTSSGAGFNNQSFDMQTYRNISGSNPEVFKPWGLCGNQAITQIVGNGTTATATVTGTLYLQSGSGVRITGAGIAAFNGGFAVTAVSGQTFSWASTTAGTTTVAGMVKTSPWDGNTNSTGYRCADQIGAGAGTVTLQGDETIQNFGAGLMSVTTQVNQALEPVYIWNNTIQGALSAGVVLNNHGVIIVANRDYYNQTTNFTGATGIGRGTLAARPATCTAGVGYWATDTGTWNTLTPGADGQLYKCISANTWAVGYTPYTYPHPLVSGTPPTAVPAAPTNVRIVP